ncbi:MAG TPA: hypothetical protein ENN36_09600 [Candidatus Bathyarchaeota archaeon]|nr:hypothetical protein [Candidatus Bathyarchaeota archaeon]
MRYNAVLLASFLFVAVCFMTVSVQPVQAAGDVRIVTHSSFYTSLNTLYIVGEVENTGDMATEFTKVNATFYDAEDQIIDTRIGYATLDVLLPGRKSPFYVMLFEDDMSLAVDDYSLTVSWKDREAGKEEGLEILSFSDHMDDWDFLHVTGEIRNTGSTTATDVKVHATFYDSEGTVVGRNEESAEPTTLSPDQTGTFDIQLIYAHQIEKVASYSLTAESEEYALVPEFPVWTTMVTALAFVALTMLVYKKKLQTRK